MTKLVIVESPTKAKKLKGWLGKGYVVESSVGHIRDLPSKPSDVPAKYKDDPNLKHGLIMDDEITAVYIPTDRGRKVISDLKKKLKDAEVLILATDPDREGESISWHLKEALSPKVPVLRVTFNEVTKRAVEAAFDNPREIDAQLVNAQETRRILDRLVGYEISPILWRKIGGSLSAGRVQSVAVRLIVERERARMRFKTASYWDLEAELAKDGMNFEAGIVTLGGKDVVTGKRFFDAKTGELKSDPNVVLLDEEAAKATAVRLEGRAWTVSDVDAQSRTSKPPEPFITDTLVGAANSRLNLGARDAMRTAQRLYEDGHITYHRTDSPSLGDEGMKAARAAVVERYGNDYLHPQEREYTAKSTAGAQEAHEAIRPAGESFTPPQATGLKGKDLDMYRMIYARTLASQMKDERYTSTTILVTVEDAVFKATGKKVDFPGWRKAYGYDEEKDTLLPALAVGDVPTCERLEAVGHETKPPARYTEGSLIKALKEDGVGRPSTYASIMETIQRKEYAYTEGRALVPSFTAFAVTQLMEQHFPEYVDEGFTARMEETLDEIAAGKTEWQPWLREFYKGDNGLANQIETHTDEIDPRAVSTIPHPALDGTGAVLRVGRYGPYLETTNEDGEPLRANVPADVAPADLDRTTVERLLKQATEGPEALGTDPASGQKVFLLDGRYGPYFQLGEAEGKEKPPRASIPRGWDPAQVTLDDALFLLSLPKEIGPHPDGGVVLVGLGRFGPYVAHQNADGDRDFRSLQDVDHMKRLTHPEALEILAQPKARGRRQAKVLKELGAHPEDGEKVQVLDGRYGPYVKHQKVNATIPKGEDPGALTLERAVELIAEKAAKKPKKRAAKKRSAKKATKKAAKKSAKKASKKTAKKAAKKGDD